MAITEELQITSRAMLGPLNQMVKGLKDAGMTIEDLDGQSKQAAQGSNLLQRGMKGLKTVAAGLFSVLKTAGPAALMMFGKMAINAFEDTRMALADVRASFGATADDWISWSEEMQRATTFSNEAFLSAATNMRTLVANYGLAEGQVRNLIAATADLAALKGLDLLEATERVQSAIRGEAEASEYLGLTLNDTYMKNIAFNGSLKGTWETLTDVEKAQYRYQEALNQMAYAEGTAAAQTETLSGAMARLKNVGQDFLAEVGEKLAPTLTEAVTTLELLVTWNERIGDAMQQHSGEVAASAETYGEYSTELERAAESVGLVVDENGNLVRVMQDIEASTGMVLSETKKLVQENYMLSESEFAVQQASTGVVTELADLPPALRGAWGSVNTFGAAIDDAGESAEGAAPLFGGLADSVNELGKAFLDGIPDQEDFYKMMLETERAAGASVEELGAMAQAMGVASNEEVQAQLAMYQMVEAYNEGEQSVQEMASASALLEQYTASLSAAESLSAEAANEAAEGHTAEAEALQKQAEAERIAGENALSAALQIADMEITSGEAAATADELSSSMGRAAGDMSAAAREAANLQAQLAAIERNIEINITRIEHYERTGEHTGTGTGTQEHASGTSFAPGGLSLVGEDGPELVVLPRGSQVYSADETRQMTHRSGGDSSPGAMVTVNVYGPFGAGYTPEQAGREAVDGFVDAARARGIRI